MFTTTPDDFLSLHSVSYEDFLVLIGCSRFVGQPRMTVFVVLYNLFSFAHARGLTQDTLVDPDLGPYLTEMGKVSPNLVSVFLTEHRDMFERGVRDRANIRYLVSEDTDYYNYDPRGLFVSLDGACRCGEKLVEKGVSPLKLKIDVLLQQP